MLKPFAATIAMLAPAMVFAQAATGPATAPALVARPIAAVGAGQAVLPANSEVMVMLNEEISSKKVREGEKFRVSVIRDVMIGNYIVIPRGTPGSGEVTYRTGKGAFGKSAKMEIDLRSLDLGGRSIPISGKFRQEGAGNTGATVGTAVAAGPFAAFVTGRSAIFTQGREFRAYTTEPMTVTLAAN